MEHCAACISVKDRRSHARSGPPGGTDLHWCTWVGIGSPPLTKYQACSPQNPRSIAPGANRGLVQQHLLPLPLGPPTDQWLCLQLWTVHLWIPTLMPQHSPAPHPRPFENWLLQGRALLSQTHCSLKVLTHSQGQWRRVEISLEGVLTASKQMLPCCVSNRDSSTVQWDPEHVQGG